MPMRSYSALEGFLAPARPQSELWRSGLGAAAIVMIYLAAGWGLLIVLSRSMPDIMLLRLMNEIASGSTPRGLVILLLSFAPLLLGTIFVTRKFHARSAATLFGPGTIHSLRLLLPWLLLFSLLTFALALLSADTGRSNPLPVVLTWAPMAVPFLAIQITAEEVLFRGYLLQQLGARSRNPLVWMVLPSALFALLHFSPGEYGSLAIWPALWAFAFGCFAADLTARTGNLGAALALHFANNFGSLFLVGFYGQLDGLALYTIVINTRSGFDMAPWLLFDMLNVVICWLIARLALRV
ncbi:hypothetical protein BMI90_05885 [Thioclava sp. L04-15]|nr:hypothetical protein BMI90_05885 [Thioclava sp. L04-15]